MSGHPLRVVNDALLSKNYVNHGWNKIIKWTKAPIFRQNPSFLPFIWKLFFCWIQWGQLYLHAFIFGQVIANCVIKKITHRNKLKRLRGPWRRCSIQLKFHTFCFLVHCHILKLGTSWISNIGAFDAPYCSRSSFQSRVWEWFICGLAWKLYQPDVSMRRQIGIRLHLCPYMQGK